MSTILATEAAADLITENGEEIILDLAAESERYFILSKVIEVLGMISKANGYLTDVNYVSETLDIKHPEELDKNKFPALFPIDGDELKEAFALFGSEGDDMQSTMELVVTGMIHEPSGKTASPRSNLIKDVEKALVMDDELTALLMERISPTRVVTDKGFFGLYSVFDMVFELTYIYDHEEGG